MRPQSLTIFGLVAIAVCGCVGVSVQPTATSHIQEKKPVAPSLTLSLNGLTDTVIAPGSPILIDVVLSTPDGRDAGTPVSIANEAGPWSELITIEIRNAQNEIVSGFGFQPLITTEGSIVLDNENLGAMAWAVSSESGESLTPGEYTVVALLDTNAMSIPGGDGTTSSGPSALTVKSALGELTEDEARLVALAGVRINAYVGDHDAALSLVDAFLGKHAKDGLMLEERADTLARAGKFEEAVVAYDAAIANVAPQEESLLREPPHLLIRKREMAAEAAKGDEAK